MSVDQDFLVRDTRNPGHFWADNEVYDIFAPQLGAYGFAVYMALCRNARNGTGECAISMSQISRDLSISKSTVHEALSRIVLLRLARLIQPGGPRLAAVYVLADVKSLTDPNFAQLRLAGKPEASVRIANEGLNGLVRRADDSVRIANVNDCEANAAFAGRTPNKEKKDSFKTQTKKTKLNTLPNPPLQGGNLNSRDRRNLNDQITFLMARHLDQFGRPKYENGRPVPQVEFSEAVSIACAQLLIPTEAAWAVINAAGLGEAKKEPQGAAV